MENQWSTAALLPNYRQQWCVSFQSCLHTLQRRDGGVLWHGGRLSSILHTKKVTEAFTRIYQIRHPKLGEKNGWNPQERRKYQLVHLTDRSELSVTKFPFSCDAVNITSRNGCLGIYLMDYFPFASLLSSSGVYSSSQILPYCQPIFFLFDK